jgi:hypothetical protein
MSTLIQVRTVLTVPVTALCLGWLVNPLPLYAAGGAYAVDDVEVGAAGSCKIETWGSFADNRDWIGVMSPACVVNLLAPVELTAQAARFRTDNDLGAAFSLKGKVNVIPVEVGKVGLGLTGGGFFDPVTGDNNGAFATVPVTFALTSSFRINLNAGWFYQSIDNRHLGYYGAGFEWNFVKPLTLIAEVYGFTNSDVREPRFQAGIRYHAAEAVDIDLVYGRNITGEKANWITVGMNLRFEASGK